MKIFFSVIIPTFHRADLVVQTVGSVLAQDFPDLEVIVVDDGGRDDTESRLLAFQDDRVRYFWKRNGERGAARNFGLTRALGKYAVFVDSDDLWPIHHLGILYSHLQSLQFPPVLAVDHLWIDSQGVETGSRLPKTDCFWTLDQMLWGNPFACNFLMAIPGERLRFVEDRCCSLGEDWVFAVQAASAGPIPYCARTRVRQRKHEGQSMQDNLRVVQARRACTDHLLRELPLDAVQKRRLLAGSHRFCSIHLHLAGRRGPALREAVQGWRHGLALSQFFLLALKALLGYRVVDRLKAGLAWLHFPSSLGNR